MTLHEFIILMIPPIGASGYKEIQYIKYTSEYISKLQIHQQKNDIIFVQYGFPHSDQMAQYFRNIKEQTQGDHFHDRSYCGSTISGVYFLWIDHKGCIES